MRKLFSLFLAVCLLAPASSFAQSAQALPEGYRLFAQSGRLALYGDEATGGIILEDLSDGYRWYSNPLKQDKKAKGVHRQTTLSQVLVSYSNERGTALTLSSAADSVKSGGMSMQPADRGMEVAYDFKKAGIRLKLRYELEEDHLLVRLPVEEIVCYPDEDGNPNPNSVSSVDVLPVFGAGGADEQGYLLIPDGSGALIRFNNGTSSMPEYSALLYGKDYGVEGQILQSAVMQSNEQPARMPVFGTYHAGEGEHGLFAVITQNDAKAKIIARVSYLTSYNYVYSRFMVKTAGSMEMYSKEFGSSVISVAEREGLTKGSYELRYYPLSGKDAGYPGMARRYREYLKNNQGLEQRVSKGEYPLLIDAYGYLKKQAQLAGIPYTKTVPLTGTGDIGRMIDEIGVPQTVLRYQNWMPDTFYEKIPQKAELLGLLGSMEELLGLEARLRAQGGALYPAASLMEVYRQGRGFWAIRDAVLSPVNTPQLRYQLQYGSRSVNRTVSPWYLLSPAKYQAFYLRYFDSFSKTGFSSIALPGLADICTSDNRSGGTGRGEVPGIVRGVLASSKREMMLDGGNMYAAVLASLLADVPGGSSGYDIADESVPFYQMVLHGSIPYSIGLMNHAAQPRRLMLKMLEYGASPHFALIGRNIKELSDSRMLWLLSPDYHLWSEEIRSVYGELSSVLAPLSHLAITDHRNLEGGSVTVYGGTTAVYVNYTRQETDLEGHSVPAEGYLVVEVKENERR